MISQDGTLYEYDRQSPLIFIGGATSRDTTYEDQWGLSIILVQCSILGDH